MAHMSRESKAITIAITDNDPITVKALETILKREFSVLWTELSGRATIIRCIEDKQIPDVLLMDMALSDMPGIRVCQSLRSNFDVMPILAITSYPPITFAAQAAEAGVQGIIGKADIRNIAQAVSMLASGMVVPPLAQCGNVVFKSVACSHEDLLRKSRPDEMKLASREIEILDLVLQGMTQLEISKRLNISAVTIRTYTKRAREKLHCNTLEQAVARWATLRHNYPQFR